MIILHTLTVCDASPNEKSLGHPQQGVSRFSTGVLFLRQDEHNYSLLGGVFVVSSKETATTDASARTQS